MHKDYVEKITSLGKLLVVLLLIGMLFITKSIYLILFITILTIYLLLLLDKSVNIYIKIFKNYSFLLLFFLLLYIIISRNDIYTTLIFIYKLLISTLLLSCFFTNTNFYELNLAIYKILRPLEKIKIDANNVSYNITIYLYYINYLFMANEKILYKQQLKKKKTYNFKNLFLPSLIYADKKTTNLKMNLKLNNYNLKLEKENKSTIFILLFFVVLFIVTIIKGVI